MVQKPLFYGVMAALLTSPIQANEGVQTSFERSFETFKDICFKPLPDSESFFAAMDASGIDWKKNRKERDSKLGRGDSWSADQGIIRYQYLPSSTFSVVDPACEFEFAVDDEFDHQLARQEISTFLLLKSKNTSDKYGTKSCWQGEIEDGRNIRFTLKSQFSDSPRVSLSIGFIKKLPVDLEVRLKRSGQLNCK